MKTSSLINFLLLLSIIIALFTVVTSQQTYGKPAVSNVVASQRMWPDGQVDIYYDAYNSQVDMLSVSVAVSTNFGAAYDLPATHFTGDVGDGVLTGMQKHIVWDAGEDWFGNTSDTMRVKITVDDTMCYIPAGTFSMGDNFNEGWTNERPVHDVYISAFFMDRNEVSNEKMRQVLQWAQDNSNLFVNSITVKNIENYKELLDLNGTGCQISWNGSSFVVDPGKENYPCVELTWYGAMAYCKYKNDMEGKEQTTDLNSWTIDWTKTGYRLPAEAEWEKAARGGEGGHRFPWHDSDLIQHTRANYYSTNLYAYDTSSTSGYHPDFDTGTFPYTSPVGYFSTNAYGLFDMAGNTWEWCWDRFLDTYYSTSPGSDPHGPSSGSERMLRGGCWYHGAILARCSFRRSYNPVEGWYNFGFRCVRLAP